MDDYKVTLKGEGTTEVTMTVQAPDWNAAKDHDDFAAFLRFGFRVDSMDKVESQTNLDRLG